MIYSTFKDKKLSLLGFGTMRLPLLKDGSGEVDEKLGRIRHLGFSTHGFPDTLESFLDRYGDVMEFCQIQLNYLDWTLQNAKAKYELALQELRCNSCWNNLCC